MWTRTYLLLLAVRLYFALSPSYIHPDENFQGPEVIAGRIFSLPHRETWEFTSDKPVRSVFPLWTVYGLPMLILKGVWIEAGMDLAPKILYYTLRVLMFILSLVLEDWAIHELVQSPRRRRLAVTLVASSYVTWTYQTHTFSNSIETLAVLWSLVMIQRILDNKQRSSVVSSAILGCILTFGVFNRVTFPAFTLAPCLFLLPHFYRRPFSLLALSITTLLTTLLALTTDTTFYHPDYPLSTILTSPTLTPLNSLLYNTNTSNLSAHGLHPHYQHLTASLPLLLGPALLLLPTIRLSPRRLPILSVATGTLLLSSIPHQEARFLLPLVPLILSSIQLPRSKRLTHYFLAAWIAFNLLFGILMGTYHQGGIVPAQIWLSQHQHQHNQHSPSPPITALSTTPPPNPIEIFYYRTYPPPIYLLAPSPNLKTTTLMGIPLQSLHSHLLASLNTSCTHTHTNPPKTKANTNTTILLVAPWSSTDLDSLTKQKQGQGQGESSSSSMSLTFEELWRYDRHLNLDDLDFGGGVWGTFGRVVGRRGLVVWGVVLG